MIEEPVADDADDQLCLGCPLNKLLNVPKTLCRIPLLGRTAMHCRPLQHNTGPTAYAHIGPSAVGWPLSYKLVFGQ